MTDRKNRAATVRERPGTLRRTLSNGRGSHGSVLSVILAVCLGITLTGTAAAELPSNHPLLQSLQPMPSAVATELPGQLQSRADRETDPARRRFWLSLRRYALEDVQSGTWHGDLWGGVLSAAKQGHRPLVLPRAVSKSIGTGVEGLKPYSLRLDVGVLPVADGLLVFEFGGEELPTKAAFRNHLNDLRDMPAGAERASLLERIGPVRWTSLLARVEVPEDEQPHLPDLETGTLSGADLELKYRRSGANQGVIRLKLPDLLAVAAEKPLPNRKPMPLPTPMPMTKPMPRTESGPVWIVIDWSSWMAAPRRRAELQKFLALGLTTSDGPRPDWHVELVASDGGVSWPVADLIAGRWPEKLPAPHEGGTWQTLGQAAANFKQAPRGRWLFVTWNPALSLPPDTPAPPAELRQAFGEEVSQQTKSTKVFRVVQIRGERLPSLTELIGPEYHDVYADWPSEFPNVD